MKAVSASVAFKDPLGVVVASGKLILDLTQPAEVTSGGGLITPTRVVLSLTAGGLISSINIIFNDEITPSGTTYHAVLYNSAGSQVADFGQWSFTGASVDLSTMVPSSSSVSYSGAVLLSPTGSQTITSGNLTLTTGNIALPSGTLSLGGGTALATTNRTGTGNLVLATSPTIASPIINGTPTGTGIPTVTLKKGTGAGNYTSASTTPVQVDGTNLTYTVTIPTGWKLTVQASGTIGSNTASVTVAVSIADGGTRLQEVTALAPVVGVIVPFSISYVINGDGASHTIDLRYFTTNAADSVAILNGTSIQLPTMVFALFPSN